MPLSHRLRRLPRVLLLAACALGVGGPVAAQDAASLIGAPTMPLSEVRPGMRGTGYTVVQGVEPSTFQAEVLGVLPDVFPKQSLIVARLTGLGLERSGVVAGMSGSPVVIDGRIVGSVAYRLVSFGHEAIAGIVPIDAMLDLERLEGSRSDEPRTASADRIAEVLGSLAAATTGKVDPRAAGEVAVAPGIQRIATPLSMSGWNPALLSAVAPVFESFGWLAGAGGGSGGPVDARLVPGGSIAVQLVRGDVNVSASGTIGYVDGDRVYAFGHPFLQGGSVDFPMVPAEVITILSASQASSKLTVSGPTVIGAIRQDRQAAILGLAGLAPRMVPVRSRVVGEGIDERLDFEIVADPVLTPLYLFLGLVNGVQSLDAVYGDGAIEVAGRIRLEGNRPELRFGDLFSTPNQAILSLSSTLAAVFGSLYDNPFESVGVADVELEIGLRSDRLNASIERVWVDRTEAAPGDELRVRVALRPYRGQERVVDLPVRLPEDLQTGPLQLLIGSGRAIVDEESRLLAGGASATDVDSLIARLNDLPRSDRLHLLGYRQQGGAVVQGQQLPGLPASVLEVLGSDRGRGGVVALGQEIVLRHSAPTDFVLDGSHRLQLEIRRR